jgi:predicted nucleotidyltransferase
MVPFSPGSNRGRADEFSYWLTEALTGRAAIRSAFIFGSVARNESRPADCDLALVVDVAPLSVEWADLKSWVQKTCQRFVATFGVPLSVVILNEAEVSELSAFFGDVCNLNLRPIE